MSEQKTVDPFLNAHKAAMEAVYRLGYRRALVEIGVPALLCIGVELIIIWRLL